MTPAERSFYLRLNRRAAGLSPLLAAALLRAFQVLRDQLSDAELTRLVAQGADAVLEALLSDAILNAAFTPVRDRMRRTTADAVRYFATGLPKGGKVDGQLAIAFDYLNPRVIDAVRALDTKVIARLATEARETVRAFVENGIRDGVNPRTTARALRSVIGLAPNQSRAVDRFRQELVNGDRAALQRALRRGVMTNPDGTTTTRSNHAGGFGINAKTEAALKNTLGREPLKPEQIDRLVEQYGKRMLAWNAETNARTATLDSLKLGQRLAWDDAAEKGIIDGDRLRKKWSGTLDDRERPEHVAMEGESVGADEKFSNGEMIPGDSTFNCRCIAIYFVGPRRG